MNKVIIANEALSGIIEFWNPIQYLDDYALFWETYESMNVSEINQIIQMNSSDLIRNKELLKQIGIINNSKNKKLIS